MNQHFTLAQIDETAAAVRARCKVQPEIGLILGTGLGAVGEAVENGVRIPYGELPHFPVSTVQGHSGRMIVGTLEGKPVLVMQGRIHFYEGYSMQQVTFPIRVMQRLGIRTLIVTNAAGGINVHFAAGDIMLITDHINLLGMAGHSPLTGPNLDEIGERFPDMSQAYDRELLNLARQVAADEKIKLQEGVYVCLSGPSFETPADLRFLRAVGADAVGMSTVPEVSVARHGKMRVLGFSGITNKASLDGNAETTHEEVLETGDVIAPKMIALLCGVLRRI